MIGGIAENNVKGGAVGATFACIIGNLKIYKIFIIIKIYLLLLNKIHFRWTV